MTKTRPTIHLTTIANGKVSITELETVPKELNTSTVQNAQVAYVTVVHETHFWMRFYKNELYFRTEYNFGTYQNTEPNTEPSQKTKPKLSDFLLDDANFGSELEE